MHQQIIKVNNLSGKKKSQRTSQNGDLSHKREESHNKQSLIAPATEEITITPEFSEKEGGGGEEFDVVTGSYAKYRRMEIQHAWDLKTIFLDGPGKQEEET